MLLDILNNRRRTDSGLDIPMLPNDVMIGAKMHTFHLDIVVAAISNNLPAPCLLVPRSSLSKSPFRLANSIGLIDMGYRGEVMAKVDVLYGGIDTKKGERLFQICSHSFLPWDEVILVDDISRLPEAPDDRNNGGFGSTG
jgi:dUTP pyrophosphatase